MKLTYATDFDITNLNSWSGLAHYYSVMLKNAGFELDYLNKVHTPFHSLHLMKRFLMKRMADSIYSPRFNINVSKKYAEIIQKKISPDSAIISPNTGVLANLHGKNKRVLYADATFERLVNLYPFYSKLSKKCMIEGHEVDRQAIHNCDMLIYSSQWAADSAINYYNADPSKIFIAPFGANLEKIPNCTAIKNIIRKRCTTNELHILFLGVDWKRKGGDAAIEVIKRLNQNGINATLHVVGVRGKLPVTHDHIINHGFIGKATLDGQEKLTELLSMCHFLLLPTMADCTPVCFSEANAYGMPCITTNVGGNSCIILNEINGKVFDLSTFTEEAVAFILKVMESPGLYEQLCFSSYNRYCSELNWTTTGNKIYKLISGL